MASRSQRWTVMHGPSSKRFVSVEDFRSLPREHVPAIIDDENPALSFDTIECHLNPFEDRHPSAPKISCALATGGERERRARHRARARDRRCLFEQSS
jgi:hypothetical protein